MFYKIIKGFGSEDFVEITAEELQKALYCFLEKKDSLFSGGNVRGSLIQDVKPDYHRTMGWNRGYKLGADDFAELSEKGIDRKMQNFLNGEQQKVQYLIKTKQTHLIGTKFEMPKIESPVSKEVKKLASSKRIK